MYNEHEEAIDSRKGKNQGQPKKQTLWQCVMGQKLVLDYKDD